MWSKSVFVLLASLVAGYLAGKPGLEATAGFFVTPFQGVLTLILLEMGLEAGRQRIVSPACTSQPLRWLCDCS